MKESQRKYKKKIIRKYVEIYPSDKELLQAIEACKVYDIAFSRYVKELIRNDEGATALVLSIKDICNNSKEV